MEFLDTLLGIDPNYIVIGLIAFFFSLEQLSKSPFNFTKRINHLFQNLLFQITLVILNIFFVTFQVFSIEWFNANHIWLLYVIELPFWVKLGLSVALYDITAYWIHRATHKIPLLWRFHRVHHSDTTMDASTVFRFHPLEMPDQHRVHHQQDQFYTDSNFADIFIIWDRLFGTYKEMPVAQMKYGLKEFDEEKKQTFLYLMKSPFLTIKRIETNKTNPSKPENKT